MTRTLVKMLKGALCAGAIISCGLLSTPVQAQVVIHVPFPPAPYIATTSPVYYEGHAAYWFQNRWHYRDGGAWRYYENEPAHLREYRGNHQPSRQYYGRAHGGGFRRGRP